MNRKKSPSKILLVVAILSLCYGLVGEIHKTTTLGFNVINNRAYLNFAPPAMASLSTDVITTSPNSKKSPSLITACTLEVKIHAANGGNTIIANTQNYGFYDVYTTIKPVGCPEGISKVTTSWSFDYSGQSLFITPTTGQSQKLWTPVCSGYVGGPVPCTEYLEESFIYMDSTYNRTGLPNGYMVLADGVEKRIALNWMRPATWLQCGTYYPITIKSATSAQTGMVGSVSILPTNARIYTGNCTTPTNTPTPVPPSATSTQPSPTPIYSPADYDTDGDVDYADRTTFMGHYITQNNRSNFDGVTGVDTEDYQWFLHYFQTQ